MFFFNDTATTEIYTLSLHDALPICCPGRRRPVCRQPVNQLDDVHGSSRSGQAHARPSSPRRSSPDRPRQGVSRRCARSEEHTSELQSRQYLVCRLLLEKKKKNRNAV